MSMELGTALVVIGTLSLLAFLIGVTLGLSVRRNK